MNENCNVKPVSILDRRSMLKKALAGAGAAAVLPVVKATAAGAAASTSHTLVRFEFVRTSGNTWAQVTTGIGTNAPTCVPSRWGDASDIVAPATATVSSATRGLAAGAGAVTITVTGATFLVDPPFVDLSGSVTSFGTAGLGTACRAGSGTANTGNGTVPATTGVPATNVHNRVRFVVATD